MTSKVKGYIIITALVCGITWLAFYSGERHATKITRFSQLIEKTQGRKAYLMDLEVVCSNGKDLGKLQVDLDLTNGRVIVVRNDNKLVPNCDR